MKDNHGAWAKRRKKRLPEKIAAQLAPLEKLDQEAASKQGATATSDDGYGGEQGTIVVDSAGLPKGWTNQEEKNGWLGIEPVVLVILTLLLAFIVFIAWKISEMPTQPPGT